MGFVKSFFATRRRAVIAICLGLAGLGSVIAFTTHAPVSDADFFSLKNRPAQLAHWEERIRSVGAATAYAELGERIGDLSNLRQHLAAHFFGEALYETNGMSSATVCDDAFGQGCRHSFFTAAMQQEGPDQTAAKLEAICEEQPTVPRAHTCEHAIGHGLLAYYGYTPEALATALDSCERIAHITDFTFGCGGGAFMEYNFRLFLQADGISFRPLTETNTYDSCSSLPDTYRGSCVFWQPVWWFRALSKDADNKDHGGVVGALCRNIPFGTTSTTECLRGMGYAASWILDFDAEAVAKVCVDASPNLHDRLSCWAYTGGQLRTADMARAADSLCIGYEGAELAYCLKHNKDIKSVQIDFNPLL